MPNIVRKSGSSIVEVHRGVVHAVSWQTRSSLWSPPTDIYETGDEFVVRVEIAGVQEKDFEVSFQNGELLIAGLRSDAPERRAYHQMEIRFGKFAVGASFADSVDVDNATAHYVDGFLTVTLPKKKNTQTEGG